MLITANCSQLFKYNMRFSFSRALVTPGCACVRVLFKTCVVRMLRCFGCEVFDFLQFVLSGRAMSCFCQKVTDYKGSRGHVGFFVDYASSKSSVVVLD